MARSTGLANGGFEPVRVHTIATVHLADGEISLIEHEVQACIAGIDGVR